MTVADVWFTTGASHVVGQDYAVSGHGPGGHAVVVCDGCSSSPDTDIGARILARATLADLTAAGTFEPGRVLAAVRPAAAVLDLPPAALDATVVWALARPDGTIEIGVYGDGTVAARYRDGTVLVWSIEHPESAPRYLSYALDPSRAQAYRERFADALVVHQRNREGRFSRARFDGEWFALQLDARDFTLVLVGSDGLSSFAGPAADGGRAPVGVEEVVEPLMRVPHPRGRFVARRCRRVWSRDLRARGWTHHDDVGVGAIALDPVLPFPLAAGAQSPRPNPRNGEGCAPEVHA